MVLTTYIEAKKGVIRIPSDKTQLSWQPVLIAFFLFLLIKVDAQNPDWHWAKSIGGIGYEGCSYIAVDQEHGDVYTTGDFYGTVDFDPGAGVFNLTSAGEADIFISKVDSSGHFVWAKVIGGISYESSSSIVIDNNGDGSVYSTGIFSGTVDFDPGSGISNLTGGGMYISKLDSDGHFVWAKAIAGPTGRSITIDPSGNGSVYTTGTFVGTIDFDPGAGISNLTSAGVLDIFISKLDNDGNFVWAKALSGIGYEASYAIAVDPAGSGGVYTTGIFYGTSDFDPGAGVFNLTSAGGPDIFISKLDGSGNFVWAKAIGGSGGIYNYESGNSIAVDISGNGDVYTTGMFEDTVDFDPGGGVFNLISAGGFDFFISKLDATGNFVWAKAMGAAGDEVGYSIAVDPTGSGSVYTTGVFLGTVDFDPGTGTYNLSSPYVEAWCLEPDCPYWPNCYYDCSYWASAMFISKLDGPGNFIWATAVGGTDFNDYGQSIALDTSGNVFIAGYFSSPSIQFGSTTLTNVGGYDIFIAKLNGCNSMVASASDTGFGSLRDICSCAPAGSTIHFSLPPMSQITLTSGEIVIHKNLTLSGLGTPDLSISGNNATRIFHVLQGKSLEIESIILKNATSSLNGGAIFVEGSLMLNNVTLENNFQNGIPKGLTISSPGGLVTINGIVDIKQ